MTQSLVKREELNLLLPGRITRTSLELPENLPYDDWLEVGEKLSLMEQSVQWWIGDWIRFGERKYGEMYSQALDDTRYDIQSLMAMVYVADKVETLRRRKNLSWSHHREVASLEAPQQEAMLDLAEKERLSVHRLRTEIRRTKMAVGKPPMPAGVFDVIYADPPWPYDNQIESWGPTSLHYQSMPLAEIQALKIPSADNATLFLWATNPFLEDALEVVKAWGFEYKTNIVWVKTNLQRPGSGFYVRGRHELLFICTKGSHVPDQEGKEPLGSVLHADVQEHSRKPEEVYSIIESMYPDASYLELFARQPREGWTSWGNELVQE